MAKFEKVHLGVMGEPSEVHPTVKVIVLPGAVPSENLLSTDINMMKTNLIPPSLYSLTDPAPTAYLGARIFVAYNSTLTFTSLNTRTTIPREKITKMRSRMATMTLSMMTSGSQSLEARSGWSTAKPRLKKCGRTFSQRGLSKASCLFSA